MAIRADDFQVSNLFDAYAALEEAALIMLDTTGTVLRWSSGAQKLYGYHPVEVVDRPFSILFKNKESHLSTAHLIETQNSHHFEYEGWQRTSDSALFQCRISYSCIYNADGEVAGYLMLSRNLSGEHNLARENELFKTRLEQEVAERTRQLQTSNDELEAFSYSVSHDLRAPLRAINGFSQVVIEQYSSQLDAEGIRLMEVVHWNANLMGQLIDDLLKFSRLSKLNVMVSVVNMESIVRKALSILLMPGSSHKYQIEVHTIHNCIGDETMLLQVWMNLIDNAIKYSSKNPHPCIEIGSSEEPAGVRYYIKDNGVGFDMKYSDKLFGVFQRLHTHDEFSGTGLGLALTKRIISKHGGQIHAHGKVKEGAEFTFYLPKSVHEQSS